MGSQTRSSRHMAALEPIMSDTSFLYASRRQPTFVGWAVQTIRFLAARQRTRRALGALVDDRRALDDVGLTVAQARRESSKWFWM